MALTKTQINYLEQKLQRVVTDKIETFKKENQYTSLSDLIVARLKKGEVKLISKSEIIKLFTKNEPSYSYYYNPSISLSDLINKADYDILNNEYEQAKSKVENYSTKLQNAKQNALDKIVLEGVDFETAIAELNNVR